MDIGRLKPGAPKAWLHSLSGLTWSAVGFILGRWTWVWLSPLEWTAWLPIVLAGALLALGIQIFFGRLARRNIARIEALPARPCLFAFQSWSSYLLVLVMVSLGLGLRASPIGKPLLGGLYLAIGGGLFLASLRYYQHLLRRKAEA
jgi:hypothetical protein